MFKVIRVGRGLGCNRSYESDARFHSYTFEKVKQDGSKISGKLQGWNCQSFDHDLIGKGLAERHA